MESPKKHHRPAIDDAEIRKVVECVVGELGEDLSDEELLELSRSVANRIERESGRSRRVAKATLNGGESKTKLTPPELAELWGISPDKVHAWIRSGELRAINVATTPGGRPRYVIDREDIIAFELKRSIVAPPQPRRRRSKRQTNVIEFY